MHDTLLLAFRLAEDHRNPDAGHGLPGRLRPLCTMMMTQIASQEEVDAFLPELALPHRLDGRPRVVGGLDFPHQTEEYRKQHLEAMRRVPLVYGEVQDAFEKRSAAGRTTPSCRTGWRTPTP